MTPKSFFIIVIKTLGIYIAIELINVVPRFFSLLAYFLSTGIYAGLIAFVIGMMVMGVYIVILRFLLFKSDEVVERLSLDKNFTEEEFEFNIHRSTILKIAIIVIGGVTMIFNFVPFVIDLFSFIRIVNSGGYRGSETMLDSFLLMESHRNVSPLDLIRGGIMTLVGHFLATNSRSITNLIEKLRYDAKDDPDVL